MLMCTSDLFMIQGTLTNPLTLISGHSPVPFVPAKRHTQP